MFKDAIVRDFGSVGSRNVAVGIQAYILCECPSSAADYHRLVRPTFLSLVSHFGNTCVAIPLPFYS